MSSATLTELERVLREHTQDEFGLILTHWIVSLGAMAGDGHSRHAIITPEGQASYIGDGLANAYIHFEEDAS
jgi:hypothetical protein